MLEGDASEDTDAKTRMATRSALSLFGPIAAAETAGERGGGPPGAGAGGQSGPSCRVTSDCPKTGNLCIEVACVSGFCGENATLLWERSADQACRDASANWCRAAHQTPTALPTASTPSALSRIRQQGACTTVQKPEDMPCSTGICLGGMCKSQCNADAQCQSAMECNVPACTQGVCAQKPGPDGAMCNWNDLPIATCKAGDCRVCQDTACDTIDTHESNDTQATAYDLGGHTDCDHYGFCASLTDGDVDWYTYQGSDTFGCNVAPSVDFDAPNLEVCQYWSCDSVPTLSTCPDGTTPDTAPGGQPGCCSSTSFSYDPCNGGVFDSEDAHVWIKVSRSSGSGCEPYAFGIEF